MEIFSNLNNFVVLFYVSWWVLDINTCFPYPAFNSQSLLHVYFYAPAYSYSLVQACGFCFISPVTSPLAEGLMAVLRRGNLRVFFFPGFLSCSLSLLCEQPPLSGSAAWGTAVLPGELQTHRCLPAPCSITHPRHGIPFSTLPGFCLGLVPAVHHACCVQLQDQNTATAIHTGRSFPYTGLSGICGVGVTPPCAGCLYISKEGSFTQMDCLGLDYSLFIPV